MARSIFVSFHYQRDIWRVNQVRNHYLTKGGYQEAGFWDHSLWEKTKLRGPQAIERLIYFGLLNTSVTVVLIGNQTSERSWVIHEIRKSFVRRNGMLGIYIHNLRDQDQRTDRKGQNPFDELLTNYNGRQVPLSSFYPTYDWVLGRGYNNFGIWVERAARAAGR